MNTLELNSDLTHLENTIILMVMLAPFVVVLALLTFAADHWDNSGKTFPVWFMAGFASPWRCARRFYWRKHFNKLPREVRSLAEYGGIDAESLITRGYL